MLILVNAARPAAVILSRPLQPHVGRAAGAGDLALSRLAAPLRAVEVAVITPVRTLFLTYVVGSPPAAAVANASIDSPRF